MAADADIDVTKCKAGYSVYVMPRRNMARNIAEHWEMLSGLDKK